MLPFIAQMKRLFSRNAMKQLKLLLMIIKNKGQYGTHHGLFRHLKTEEVMKKS